MLGCAVYGRPSPSYSRVPALRGEVGVWRGKFNFEINYLGGIIRQRRKCNAAKRETKNDASRNKCESWARGDATAKSAPFKQRKARNPEMQRNSSGCSGRGVPPVPHFLIEIIVLVTR